MVENTELPQASLVVPKRAWIDRGWNLLSERLLMPLGDALFGQRLMQRLRFLRAAQWWPRERLVAERDRALQRLVDVAYREVPFYRELFDLAGRTPHDVRTPADLAALPVVTKDTLRAAYPGRCSRPTGQRTWESRTSGSTGKNFGVLEDMETAGWYRASFMLALEWAGWRIGERHMQTGMTLQRNLPRRLKDSLLRCRYVSAFDLSDAQLDANLQVLERERIQHLFGYPASLYFLARRALQAGWNRPLRSIVTWGDNCFPEYRRTLRQAFQVAVTDTYGCAEGIQISAQCGTSEHYHVHTLDVVVEYLDDAGQPVPPSQSGGLVLTRLHAGPMPLIRYRIGDLGTAGDQSPCPCGRSYERMAGVQGRDTDVVVTPAGNRLIVHFFTGILEHFDEIDSFQVVQEELARVHLRLVARTPPSRALELRIVAALAEKGAADVQFEIEWVPEIPLAETGKRRFVISKLPRPPAVPSPPGWGAAC